MTLRTILALMTLLHAATLPVAARTLSRNTTASPTLSLRMMELTHDEVDSRNQRLLRENGYLLGLDLRSTFNRNGRPELHLLGQGFLGEVDYRGQTQLGEPLTSTTEYFGGAVEAALGIPYTLSNTLRITPQAGLGGRIWLRRLDNTGRFEGGGYNELWTSLYATLALRASWRKGPHEWFALTTLRQPLRNRVEYDFGFLDDTVKVSPGKTTMGSLEVGRQTSRTVLSLFLEQWDSGSSGRKTVSGLDIFQYEVEQRIIGFRFGVSL
ncbi:MAG TPA: hypothetical protein PKE55_07720 [Kiritimatiellia bacterium]|nr:hypothetical protein [Kiritimatiellia bacterium]